MWQKHSLTIVTFVLVVSFVTALSFYYQSTLPETEPQAKSSVTPTNELGLPHAENLVSTFQKSSHRFFEVVRCDPNDTTSGSVCINRKDVKKGETLAILMPETVCYGSPGASRDVQVPNRPGTVEGLELIEHNCTTRNPAGSFGVVIDKVSNYLPLKQTEVFNPGVVLKLIDFLKKKEVLFQAFQQTAFVVSAEFPPKIRFIEVAGGRGLFVVESKMSDQYTQATLVDRTFLIGNGGDFELSLGDNRCTTSALVKSFVLNNIITVQLFSCDCESDTCRFEFVEAG